MMEHIDNIFSYCKGNTRNWIERQICPTYYVVIKRIDNDNAELYFRNLTASYCIPPMFVSVIDIVSNISIPCLSNNSYPFSSLRSYKITIGEEDIFLNGYTEWIIDKRFNTTYLPDENGSTYAD